MMITHSPSSTASMIMVPSRSRARVRRLIVQATALRQGGVRLPVTDELDEDVDLVLRQDCLGCGLLLVPRGVVREVAGNPTPVRHDAPDVLEVRETVFNAAVVVVLVEVPEAVLVVQRRPLAALTLHPVATHTVLVVQLGAPGEVVLRVDD